MSRVADTTSIRAKEGSSLPEKRAGLKGGAILSYQMSDIKKEKLENGISRARWTKTMPVQCVMVN